MTLTAPVPPPPSSLAPVAFAPEQLQAIAEARRRLRPISRAAVMSSISGWTLAVFAVITLLSGLLDVPSLLLGLGLTACSWFELRGSRGLRQFNVAAPLQLGFNQVAVAAFICLYAAWQILWSLFGPGAYADQIAANGAIAEQLKPIEDLTRALTVGFYGMVIVITLGVQSGSTIYHFTRRKHLAAFLRDTSPSIVEMLRAATG